MEFISRYVYILNYFFYFIKVCIENQKLWWAKKPRKVLAKLESFIPNASNKSSILDFTAHNFICLGSGCMKNHIKIQRRSKFNDFDLERRCPGTKHTQTKTKWSFICARVISKFNGNFRVWKHSAIFNFKISFVII